jgi:colanic acid/amylovoran biosynthesis glycosyltransferase
MTDAIPPKIRVAFVVDRFPVTSETFIIDQVADLTDRGIEVEIFAYGNGDGNFVSSRYLEYRMLEKMHYLRPPNSKACRIIAAIPMAVGLFFKHPLILIRALNFIKYGRQAWSLQLLFAAQAFIGRHFDLIHFHFGTTAVAFFPVKKVLGWQIPTVTTFYGYDVSFIFKQSVHFYDSLKQECDLFLVMSNNMKERVSAHGFPEEKIKVHPVSIDVESYPFSERRDNPDRPINLVFVGRLVEKKGCDDLLQALAKVRRQTSRALHCSIIGSGPLQEKLKQLALSLHLEDIVEFKGAMKIEDIIPLFLEQQIMISPSKTSRNGDME